MTGAEARARRAPLPEDGPGAGRDLSVVADDAGPVRSVLVADGEQRSALAVVRSLGRAGYRPFVCSARPRPLAGASRHAAGVARVTDPYEDIEGTVRDVRALAGRRGIDLVLPLTDASLTALLPARDELPGLARVCPDYETYRAVSDKARLMEAAREVGFAVPEGRVLAGAGDLPARAAPGAGYPLVVKPTRSVVRRGGRLVATPAAAYARDRAELARIVRSLPGHAFPVLLQERIEGEGRGIFLLRRGGTDLAVFAHRRVREKPPTGGCSVCRESVPADPELVARSRRLLDRFGWEGVAMVEVKRQAGTGTPYLMEVNPRFWGSLQLAVDAGVDFPRLLVAAAGGTLHRPVREYRIGVRCRWWWGEVDHLVTRLLRSGEDRLPPGTPAWWRSVLSLLAPSRRGDRTEVLRLSDPRPFLRETRRWLARP